MAKHYEKLVVQSLIMRLMLKTVLFCFIAWGHAFPVYAVSNNDKGGLPVPELWSKKQKLIATNVFANVFIGTWGIINWEYGKRDPHFRYEGWFAEDTLHGGADKIGHTYATFGIAHLMSNYFEKWGYSQNQAARYGALSSLGMHTVLELGDSFSDFGFSVQDYIMNGVGAYLGYYLYKHPERNRYVDLRVEYIPTFTKFDIFTDYHGIKYLVALKLDAFKQLNQTSLRYLELQAGFFVRGYEELDQHDRQRNIYAAVGINVTHFIYKPGKAGRPKLLNYYQFPLTYLDARHNLN